MNFDVVLGVNYFCGRQRRLSVVKIFDEEVTPVEISGSYKSITLTKKATYCELSDGSIVDVESLREIPTTDAYDLSVYNNAQFVKALKRIGTESFQRLVTYKVHYRKPEYGVYTVMRWLRYRSFYVLKNKNKQLILASPLDIIRVRDDKKLRQETM